MQTRKLTDAEIDRLGYEALFEKLGPVGATRFIGLWLERSRDDYSKVQDSIFEGMTLDELYEEAARLEAESEHAGEG
ncbi:hypothetical protein BH23ACT11_BH23ACT11_16400 [soil metagenome]